MSGICSVHSPETTDPDCAACNAVTDTDPTPERRWRWAETFPVRLVTPDGEHLYLTIRDDSDRMRVTATLNEAEDLRAERDKALQERQRFENMYSDQVDSASQFANELDDANKLLDVTRERVRVLEAAFWRTEQTEMEPDGKCGRCGFRDRHEKKCPWRVLETDGRARQVGRALAGAEPPDAGEMLGGLLREQASRKWAGAETEAGR